MTRMLYLVIIISFLDTFIQLPIITPYSLSLGASHILAGAIIAVYSLTNMIGNIIGGHWIDKFGRKRMLLVGMSTVLITLLLYPLASSGVDLLLIRMAHGLAGGLLIPAAFTYIGDRTSQGRRGKTMAFTGACIGTAAIIGPAIGGVVAAKLKVEYVFILVAILFAITIPLIIKFIPESYKVSDRGRVKAGQFIPLLKNKGLIQASLAAFALMISNGTLAFALPLKVQDLDLSTTTTGMLMSIYGIMALFIFLSPINRVFDKYSAIPIVTVGLVLIGVALFMLNYVSELRFGYIAMSIYGVGFALIFPAMNQMVADAAGMSERGRAYGIFYAFFSLGVVAGSSMSGFVSQWFGIPFIVSAVVMLLCGFTLINLSRSKERQRG